MRTSLSKADIRTRATAHFGAANYTIATESDSSMVFNGGKAINWVLFVFLLLCIIVGGIIYYVISKQHQAVLNISPANGQFDVSGTGNTNKAQKVVNGFIASLPPAK
jgi:hypothetical protein